MTQIAVVGEVDKTSRAYEQALEEFGVTRSQAPFDKILQESKQAFENHAAQAGRHYQFVLDEYADKLNRLIQNFLEPSGLAYSVSFSLVYGGSLKINLSVDTIRQVLPVIKLLIAEDLRMVEATTKSKYTTDKVWRFLPRSLDPKEYSYTKHLRLALVVSAKTCRQVKVGTKVVDEYETVCEWGEDQKDLPSVTSTQDGDLPF